MVCRGSVGGTVRLRSERSAAHHFPSASRRGIEIGDEIWVDPGTLLRAAHSAATDPETRSRFMAHFGGDLSQVRLAGGYSDREALMRIYRRRARRGGELPAGTNEFVHQLELEP